MPTITMTISPPAGGKTTWAKDIVRKRSNTIIVCRDDFRDQFYGGIGQYKFTKAKEQLVTDAQKAAIKVAIDRGQNVIIADTHCSAKYKTQWKEFAKELGADLQVQDFVKAFLKENNDKVTTHGLSAVLDMFRNRCHKWNLCRLNSVPPKVIDEMMDRYLDQIMGLKTRQHIRIPGLPKAVIFDIDGTLAHMHGKRGPFDWHNVGVDDLDEIVKEALDMYRLAGYVIIVMSGRDGVCEPETRQWLFKHNIQFDHLFMRKPGDQRNDGIVKEELFFDNVDGKFNVTVCFDDRDRVVAKWRAMGIKCFQVEPGDF